MAVRVLLDSSSELLTAADNVTHVSWPWLLAAAGAELVSYLTYGHALRLLLRSGGGRDVALLAMSAVSVASQAAAYCLPGGVAVSGTVTFRRLSRRGVDPAMTGWMLAVSTVLYLGTLAALALVGAQVAGAASNSVPDLRVTSLVMLGVVGATAQVLYLLRHLSLPGRALRWCAARLDKAVSRGRPQHRRGATPIMEWADHLSRIRVDGSALVLTASWLMVVWVSDAMCLALAFFALGATPPWQGLLLSYCAAQLAAMLPFTPGGLGVVEGSLTVALVAYGGSAPVALSAVLLYRLISFWGLLTVGATCYVGLRWGERHQASISSREAADVC